MIMQAQIARPACIDARPSGFTLVELLVVLVLISIVVGMVALSVSLVDDKRDMAREMDRLAALVQLVSDEALLQGRDYGLLVEEYGYAFLVYSYEKGQWERQGMDERLRERRLPEGLEFSLVLEGQRVPLDESARGERLAPQVAILSSGELTAFELELHQQFTDRSEWLQGTASGMLLRNPEQQDVR